MAGDGVSFVIRLDAQFEEVNKLAAALKSAEAGLRGVDSAAKHLDAVMNSASETQHRHASAVGAAAAAVRQSGEDAKSSASAQQGHTGAVEHASDAYHRHRYEVDGVGKAMREVRGRAMELAEAVGLVFAVETFKEGFEAVREFGSEIIKVAAEEERLSKSFEMSLGKEGGERATAYGEQFGKFTEFTEDQSKGFEASLIQAGVGIQDLSKYMAAAADVAAGSKDPIEGMSTAIEGLARANLTGKLDGRSLLRLHVGVPQLSGLEEFKDATEAQIKGIIESGSLTKDQVLRAIAGPDNVLGDKAVEMSKTMGSKLAHLGALPSQYAQKLFTTSGFDGLKDKFSEILESLDPDGPRGGRIFASLARSFDSLVGSVGQIDFESVASEIETEIVPDIESIAKKLGSIDWVVGAKELYGYVKDIASTLGTVTKAIGIATDAAVVLTEVSNPFELLKAGAHHVLHPLDAIEDDANGKGPMGRLVKASGNLLDDLEKSSDDEPKPWERDNGPTETPNQRMPADFVSLEQPLPTSLATPEADAALNAAKAAFAAERGATKFEDAGRNAALGYAMGIKSGKSEAQAAGAELADGTLDATNKAQDSQSPSRKFRRAGRYGGEGYALGIWDMEDEATRAGRDVADAALDAAAMHRDDRAGKPIGFDAMGLAPGESPAQAPQPQPVSRDDDALLAPSSVPPVQAAPPASARPIEITLQFNLGDISGSRRGADQADELMARLKANAPGIVHGLVEQLAIEAGV